MPNDSTPARGAWVIRNWGWIGHSGLVIGTFVAMAAWTWFAWPDPIVDFGRELYIPWQITEGKVLYRDIAYFNGPLSPYFNALVFAVFGVSLRTIVFANLTLLGLMTLVLWRVIARSADQFTATSCCVVLLTIFSFIQLVGIGNYNFITPYSHELTHGVMLSIGAIACVSRDLRTTRSIWIIGAGLLLGMALLTKAEVILAAGIAVPLGVAIASPRRVLRALGVLFAAAIVPPVVALVALWSAMPFNEAVRGVLGSLVYVTDSRISGMKFYQDLLGTSDLAHNLLITVGVALVYMLLLAPTLLLAATWKYRAAAGVIFAVSSLLAIAAYFGLEPNLWQDAFRGLGVILLIHIIILLLRWWPKRYDPDVSSVMQMVFSIFALLLLAKMALNVRVIHYGFALAMPAVIVAVAMVLSWIPADLRRWHGNPAILRAAALPVIALMIAVHLRPYSRLAALDHLQVASGADAFRTWDLRGQAVNEMLATLQSIPSHQTLAVVPEGVMINYLARRTNPTAYINLMPPEVVMFGQQRIVAEFEANPPDYIVLVLGSDPSSYGFKSFAADYGSRIYHWIQMNYDQAPARTIDRFPMILLKRKAAP